MTASQKPRTLKTALALALALAQAQAQVQVQVQVQVQRPKLRHAHSALCDQLFGAGVSRTTALETGDLVWGAGAVFRFVTLTDPRSANPG